VIGLAKHSNIDGLSSDSNSINRLISQPWNSILLGLIEDGSVSERFSPVPFMDSVYLEIVR
jgi:hypothetical protein